jgi:hypothetical protein
MPQWFQFPGCRVSESAFDGKARYMFSGIEGAGPATNGMQKLIKHAVYKDATQENFDKRGKTKHRKPSRLDTFSR